MEQVFEENTATPLYGLLQYFPCIEPRPAVISAGFMAVHAHRRGEESNDRLMQRFKKQVQDTGLLKLLRERGTWKRKPSKRLQRQKALKREEYREKNRKKKFYSNM